MAVSKTGSIVKITASGASSQSVTVPADATLAVFMICGASGTANVFDGGVAQDANITGLTLGGTTMKSLLSSDDLTSTYIGIMAYLVNPSTGSQTLAWPVGASITDGLQIYVAFFKGLDTASPFRDRSINQVTTGTATASSITASAGDLTIAFGAEGQTATLGGVTEETEDAYNNVHAHYGESTSTGAISATLGTTTWGAFVGAAIIKVSSGGGGTPGTWDATISFT